MPKLTADIGGIETGFVRPTTVVQPSGAKAAVLEGAAQVFSGVSNLAVEGVKRATTASMTEELDELEQQYIEETKQELTPDEQEEVNTFSRRIKSWKRKAQVTQKTSQYKIRAEAILREKVNQFPGLADHYRRAASSLLGFNPEGAEASMLEAELKKQAQDAEAQLKSIDNHAVNKYYLERGAVLVDPLAQEVYQAGLEADAYRADVERLVDIENAKAAMAKLRGEADFRANRKLFVDKTTNMAQDSYINLLNFVYQELSGDGVTREMLESQGLTSAVYQQVDEGKVRMLVASLESMRDQGAAAYVAGMEFADQAFKEELKAIHNAPYNEMIAALDEKATLESFKNRSSFRTQSLIEQFKDHPDVVEMQAYAAFGQQAHETAKANFHKAMINDILPVFGKSALTDDEQDQVVSKPSGETTKYLFDDLKAKMELRMATDKPADLNTDVIDRTMFNVYEAYGTSGKVSRENFRAFFEAHAQEGAEEYISNLQKVSPLFTPEIEAAAGQFAARAKADTQKRVADILKKYTQKKVLKKDKRGRNVLVEEIVPFNINVDSKGYVTLVPTEEIKAAAPELLDDTVLGSRTVKGPLFKELQKLQNSYVKDLNNAVKTMSNVWGMPPQEAAVKVFGDTGWIKEEQQGEGSE